MLKHFIVLTYSQRLFSDCQYVYDWQIPGRRFLHIRNRSDLICPARSGEPDRPDGHSIPQSYKMYIPQVWSFRQHPASRCLVRACPQHPQWEDIHLPLVSNHNHCMCTLRQVGREFKRLFVYCTLARFSQHILTVPLIIITRHHEILKFLFIYIM